MFCCILCYPMVISCDTVTSEQLFFFPCRCVHVQNPDVNAVKARQVALLWLKFWNMFKNKWYESRLTPVRFYAFSRLGKHSKMKLRVQLQCKNLHEYLKELSPDILDRLYNHPATCLAVYRFICDYKMMMCLFWDHSY